MHRDIKPENVLLSSTETRDPGHALVTDFGIARAVSNTTDETLTQAGIAVGTPAYMSPEQASADRAIDGRSDIYSLGCVLYEMLVGHPPFLGATSQEILARHLRDPLPPLRTERPQRLTLHIGNPMTFQDVVLEDRGAMKGICTTLRDAVVALSAQKP